MSESTWRYEIDGDRMVATNRTARYEMRIGAEYAPRNPASKLAPRAIIQYLDGGASLYTRGVGHNTVATVQSFVSTYEVPRQRGLGAARNDLEARVCALEAAVRSIMGGRQ